jgi:hypothetical protein
VDLLIAPVTGYAHRVGCATGASSLIPGVVDVRNLPRRHEWGEMLLGESGRFQVSVLQWRQNGLNA